MLWFYVLENRLFPTERFAVESRTRTTGLFYNIVVESCTTMPSTRTPRKTNKYEKTGRSEWDVSRVDGEA